MTPQTLTLDVQMDEHFGHTHLTLTPRGGHGSVTISTAAEDAGETLLERLSELVFAFGRPTDEDQS